MNEGFPRLRFVWLTEVLEWRYKAIQRSGANDE
ncbi:GpE family phage tail protein [Escherichia coli]|nr:GpE family phage tail protein [Escherichia coli]